jgi:hypothetical protein
MSILPLGNSSADRPAREYQERLNRPRLPRLLKDAKSDPALSASGYFSEFWGPDGICPVQLMGFLKNGEFVYFRARGKKLELEIAATVDGAPHARYSKLLDVRNSELGTGNLPVALSVEYIERWLGDYRSRCGGEDKPYSGAPFELSEAEEAITL